MCLQKPEESTEGKKKIISKSYSFGGELKGKNFNFESRAHAYNSNFSTSFLLFRKKKKANTQANSKNRTRLMGWYCLTSWEGLQ